MIVHCNLTPENIIYDKKHFYSISVRIVNLDENVKILIKKEKKNAKNFDFS